MDGIGKLPCVNCKKAIEGQLLFYEKILICSDCYKLAIRFQQRGEHEVRLITDLLKESIRVAILKSELHLSVPVEDMPQQDFFGELSRLVQNVKMQALGKKPCQTSSTITPPRVPTPQNVTIVDSKLPASS